MTGTRHGVLACVLIVLVVRPAAWGAAGDLDRSFGLDGTVVTAVGPDYDYLYDVALQPDGKIVVAGTTLLGPQLAFAVARYDVDGVLDPSFGTGGVAAVAFGQQDAFASAVALQPDGDIVLAGKGNGDFALARLTPDGLLDPSFGSGGSVTTSMESANGALAVLLQPDGRIVAVGGGIGFAVARYTPDGHLDPTFGAGGRGVPAGSGEAHAVALQTDGDLVVAGDSRVADQVDFAIARYAPDGSLDASFGHGGLLTTGIATANSATDSVDAVAIMPDGRIVVVGYSCGFGCYFALARYGRDGSLDPTFGSGGTVTTDVRGDDDFATGLAVQPDGKIIAAGSSWGPTAYDFAVVRYLPDGTLDRTFGTDGRVTTGIGPSTDIASAVALQPDGKLVVVGYTYSGTTYDFALVRYLGDSVCGNGVVEPPEQCDDGNTIDGDCCSAVCQTEPEGNPCADDGEACTTDVCDGGGACRHPAGNAGRVCRLPAGPCDAAERCDGETPSCPPDDARAARNDCLPAARSLISLAQKRGGTSDGLRWKWLRGAAVGTQEIGDPSSTSDYAICVYAGEDARLLPGAAAVPADGTKWRRLGAAGWRYRGSDADPVETIMLKGGSAGRAKMAVGATGSVLGDPGLPIPMEDVPLRMQLLNRETAACWESVFTASDVVVNDGRRFKARTD